MDTLDLAIDLVGYTLVVVIMLLAAIAVVAFVVINLYALLRRPVWKLLRKYLDWLGGRLSE